MVLVAAAYIQPATYWGAPQQSGFGGKTFASPQAILVRWEESSELFIDANGEEKRSRAIVYSLLPLEEGGYLFKGTSAASDPTTLDDAILIKRADSIPDIRNLNQTNRNFL